MRNLDAKSRAYLMMLLREDELELRIINRATMYGTYLGDSPEDHAQRLTKNRPDRLACAAKTASSYLSSRNRHRRCIRSRRFFALANRHGRRLTINGVECYSIGDTDGVEVFADRICDVCKHPPCPCCVTWCDVAHANFGMCCDTECTYPTRPKFYLADGSEWDGYDPRAEDLL